MNKEPKYMRYHLNVLLKKLKRTYGQLSHKRLQPYPSDHIFDIHDTVINNRNKVKEKNREIHAKNQQMIEKEKSKREHLLLDISYWLANEEDWNMDEIFNIIDYSTTKYLSKQERKLKKWNNVEKLLQGIDETLALLDTILYSSKLLHLS